MGSLQQLKDKATEQVNRVGSQVADKVQRSPLALSGRDNLLNSYSWHLNRINIEREFKTLSMTRKLIQVQFDEN